MELIKKIAGIDSSKRELKKFALALSVSFLIMGSIAFLRGKAFFYMFYLGSIFFAFFCFVCPCVLRIPHKVLTSIFLIIFSLTAYITLIIGFYFIVTPVGLLGKLFGKEFIDEKQDMNKETYWIRIDKTQENVIDYERQF